MKDLHSATSTHISFNLSEAKDARFNVIELGDGNALVQLEVVHSSYEGLEMLTFSSQQVNVNLTLDQVKALRLELVRYLMKVQYPNLNADVLNDEPTINDIKRNIEESEGVNL